jgi:hypothetical protein
VDRRVLSLIAAGLVAAGCGERREAAPPAIDAGPSPLPAPLPRAAAEPDAAPEDEAPSEPLPILSGPAAEQVIAETVTPREAPPADAPELLVSPAGVGRFILGLSRREVLSALGRRGSLRRVRTPPGDVGVELGELRLASGVPLLRLRVYGGRLTEVTVVARDARARTAADIGVGSTFEDARLAHGAARRAPRGYLLEDLPGVIFVPSVFAPGEAPPAPAARVTAIIVVGPEAD